MYYLCEVVGGGIATDLFSEYEKKYAQAAEWVDVQATKTLKFLNSVDSNALIAEAERIKQSELT